jgi:putative transposase
MPRRPRLHVPGACYHVILRGNHQEDIFSASEDRAVLNTIVSEALPLHGARIHAFCWMTNHLHALMQIGDGKLGDLVRRIAVRYSRYRHRQLGTTGHLFERRHRAFLVETDHYFITLLRYIHLNPVNAGMVKTASDYAWSSHRAYLGLEVIPWLTTDFGLGMFGKTDEIARRHYRIMVNGELYASELSVFEQANPNDPRVLGSDDFLATLSKPKPKARNRPTLDKLIEEVCKRNGVTVDAVLSSSRLRALSRTRTEIVRRAVAEGIASIREVAKRLRKCPSGMGKQLRRATS